MIKTTIKTPTVGAPALFEKGELLETATYIKNDGWKWLGQKLVVTEDDGGPTIEGYVQSQHGEYWEYFRREHLRRIPHTL